METQKTESARTTGMLLESSIQRRGWMTVPVRSIHMRTMMVLQLAMMMSLQSAMMMVLQSAMMMVLQSAMMMVLHSEHMKMSTKELLLELLAMARVDTY